ncbi:MAG: class I SAM-dependent methyltransferase [Kiritimatiellae bacterium]|nr:class I SAM-dependent methyltransferase [Kiritimatiellia bacterium]
MNNSREPARHWSSPFWIARKLAGCIAQRRLPDVLRSYADWPPYEALRLRYYRRLQRRLPQRYPRDFAHQARVKELCENAYEAGKQVDLQGISFGPAPWLGKPDLGIRDRYRFLAGLVRNQQLRRILEVGTWYGGSIQSMSRAIPPSEIRESLIVTVDIRTENEAGFADFRHIKRIQGDILDSAVIQKILSLFGGSLDLLYIDGDHRFEPTQRTISVYGAQLRPKWIVLDDIHLRSTMDKAWARALRKYRGRALDLCDSAVAWQFGVIHTDGLLEPRDYVI